MKRLIATLLLLVLVVASHAFGRGKKNIARSLPAGLMFPTFNTAALVNSATLPAEKGNGIQALYSPNASGSGTHAYSASLATAAKDFGLGVGYTGADTGSLTHGGYIGAGYQIDKIALGLGLRDPNLKSSFDPALDFAIDIALEKAVHFGVIIRELNKTARADLGLGFLAKNRYSLEVNLRTPEFNSVNDGSYVGTIAAATYVGILGISFGVDYGFQSNAYDYFVAGVLWLADFLYLQAKYQTPSDWTLGLTIAF